MTVIEKAHAVLAALIGQRTEVGFTLASAQGSARLRVPSTLDTSCLSGMYEVSTTGRWTTIRIPA